MVLDSKGWSALIYQWGNSNSYPRSGTWHRCLLDHLLRASRPKSASLPNSQLVSKCSCVMKPYDSLERETRQNGPFSPACSPTRPFKAKWEYANLSVRMADSLWTCLSVTEVGHVWRFQRFSAGPLFSHLLDRCSIWIINKDPSFNSDDPLGVCWVFFFLF